MLSGLGSADHLADELGDLRPVDIQLDQFGRLGHDFGESVGDRGVPEYPAISIRGRLTPGEAVIQMTDRFCDFCRLDTQ